MVEQDSSEEITKRPCCNNKIQIWGRCMKGYSNKIKKINKLMKTKEKEID